VGYYIKRRIVTDNLHGVDIMEEACEIAKLRLFLAMVASVRKVEDLEPLPNIDFNILPGNSLVGLMRVDQVEFNQKNTQMGLFAEAKPRPFSELLAAKNRKLDTYRHSAEQLGKHVNLRELRDDIDIEMHDANGVMNEILRDQFEKAQVRFEEATWDATKKQLGKPKKRPIETRDIQDQTPFHWGYVFDDIVQKRGGFDIILANPPWEVFKPQAKEFFAEYSGVVTKNKMTIDEFEKEQATLLQNAEVRAAWLAYENRFPHMSSWFRSAPEFKHQIAMVGGKKTGSDSNLYKLFVERSFHLLRPGGHCGIVIPSGIYTDLGAKGLRDLLFDQTQIEGLFCFENRKEIFEGVHRSFKFVVLTFEKAAAARLQASGERNASAPPDDLLAEQAVEAQGGATGTTRFPAAFMRHDVEELTRFPAEGALWLEVELIKRLSPDSHSVMEFKSALDVQIANRCSAFPFLCGDSRGWNLGVYGEEIHMNRGASYFVGANTGFPLYEGGMIGHFDAGFAKPRFWVNEGALRADFLEKRRKRIEGLVETPDDLRNDYEEYRIGLRKIARNTDTRTLISTIIPKNSICGNSLAVSFPFLHSEKRYSQLAISHQGLCVLVAMLNSFVVDWFLRGMMTSNLNTFYLFQLPVPKPDLTKAISKALSNRAARLICTTPEFDDLAKSVGLKGHQDGATDPTERAKLRAELDGLVAHLYGLSEVEFTHILGTFPLVAEPVKVAALNAWRDVQRGLIS
jgi:hypothetical protein